MSESKSEPAANYRKPPERAQSRRGPTSDFRITGARQRSATTRITTRSPYTPSKVPSLPLDETASGAQVGSSLDTNTLATAKIVGRYAVRSNPGRRRSSGAG